MLLPVVLVVANEAATKSRTRPRRLCLPVRLDADVVSPASGRSIAEFDAARFQELIKTLNAVRAGQNDASTDHSDGHFRFRSGASPGRPVCRVGRVGPVRRVGVVRGGPLRVRDKRLFDDEVYVEAADSERVDGRSTWTVSRSQPGLRRLGNVKRKVRPVDCRISLGDVNAGRNRSVPHRQQHFQQTR